MKKIAIIVLALVTTPALALKIGFVNVEKIAAESKSFQTEQQQVLESFKAKDNALKTRVTELEKLVKTFNTIQQDLSNKEKQEKLKIINTNQNNIKSDAAKLREQLKRAREEVLVKFQDKINQVLIQFAKNNNYDLILYKDIAYVSPAIDITDTIAKLLKK